MPVSKILKGGPAAAAMTEELARRAAALKERGLVPTLAIVRAGERGDDLAYERAAIKRCEKAGIAVRLYTIKADSSQDELISVIEEINTDKGIHGCLMFRPLPKHMDERRVCRALDVSKDVDCMTESSLAGVFTGSGRGFPPCTAQAVMELLDYYGVETAGRRSAVIGRSLVIGKPVSMLLQARDATVTMCHSKTRDAAAICREAEILVVAAGHAGTVTPEFTNPGQVIIDVGINSLPDGSLVGDVDFAAVSPLVKAVSPVPAGVGSLTTAVLCKHVIQAAERSLG